MTETDHLVAVYLARVDQAAIRLPAARREELVSDLREHIEIARAESGAETEAEIRSILERLGDPESIAAAADTQTDLPRVPPAPSFAPPAPAVPSRSGSRTLWVTLGALALAALVLVFCFGLALSMRQGSDQQAPAVPAETASLTTAPAVPAETASLTTVPTGSPSP